MVYKSVQAVNSELHSAPAALCRKFYTKYPQQYLQVAIITRWLYQGGGSIAGSTVVKVGWYGYVLEPPNKHFYNI